MIFVFLKRTLNYHNKIHITFDLSPKTCKNMVYWVYLVTSENYCKLAYICMWTINGMLLTGTQCYHRCKHVGCRMEWAGVTQAVMEWVTGRLAGPFIHHITSTDQWSPHICRPPHWLWQQHRVWLISCFISMTFFKIPSLQVSSKCAYFEALGEK